ncbi:FtsX-like permease family protein [Streptococcus cameli]
MKKKIYWKDILNSFQTSKGRFFSIFSLMMIGAIALVGLKVTTPNMERTAQSFIEKQRLFDLAVMGNYGIDQDDVAELDGINGAQVEYGYLADRTLVDSKKAIRIFSNTNRISKFQLLKGAYPQAANEIALDQELQQSYQIGDKISFTKDADSPLTGDTFTITGFVSSSEIWNTGTMGLSTAGSGELTAYAITSEKAFDSDVYMIARILYQDLAAFSYQDKTYQKKIEQYQKELEALVADNDENRFSHLKQTAQAEIDKGQLKIAQAESELKDAKQRLADAETEVEAGRTALANAKNKVTSGEDSLANTLESLKQAKKGLDETASRLEGTRQQLKNSQAVLNQQKSELSALKNQLISTKTALDAKKRELAESEQRIATSRSQLQFDQANLQAKIDEAVAAGKDPDTIDEIIELKAVIQDKEAQLYLAEQALEVSRVQYQDSLAQYEASSAQYQQGESQYQAGLSQFKTAKTQYDNGLEQYQAGLASYEEGMTQYKKGRHHLKSSKKEIRSKEASLASADSELGSSKKRYNKEAEAAQKDIAAAQKKLIEAQDELNRLAKPSYRVYTRSTLPGGGGYDTYVNATKSISSVGDIFPVVLYLVAALVTFTTMTRFVDEERNNAGILKALGYENKAIIQKFVLYGLVASFLGTLVGILAGNFILSPVISDIITSNTVIGDARRYFYPSWTALAFVLAFLSAVLPAYLVARKELTEEAAYLLQAKPPVSGSSILLEKISFLWNRMSFTHKVTARNIFRYKQRMLMTIFGVAGSVALLFAGLGIQSSISGIVDRQFGDITRYDMMVLEDTAAKKEDRTALMVSLKNPKIQSSKTIEWVNVTERIKGVPDKQDISLLVLEDADIREFIQLQTRKGESLSLTDKGVILSEKLASLYGVAVGDKLEMTIHEKTVSLTVSGVSEMYAGHFVYMTAAYYKKVMGEGAENNAHLLVLKKSTDDSIRSVAADFLKMKGVANVVQNTANKAAITTIADSLQSVMIILIVLSVLLGVVILYNLTNINVAERIRELSTIKVLGFHNKEVTLYIYRETIVLSLVGILTGLIGGLYLHRLILTMIGTDSLQFDPVVPLYVYLIPILAITGILAVLGWLVNHRLRHVDMLEALKSVE